MKNRSINMLIVGLILLGLLAAALIFFLEDAKDKFPDRITVSENGETDGIMKVRDLKLAPTESREYVVNLVCAASGSYDITLDYEETADGGMKQFVDVTVKVGGKKVYAGSLTELIDGGVLIEFEGVLEETEPLPLSVTYTMPREVGNEAQGTYADFDVHIKIKKS